MNVIKTLLCFSKSLISCVYIFKQMIVKVSCALGEIQPNTRRQFLLLNPEFMGKQISLRPFPQNSTHSDTF